MENNSRVLTEEQANAIVSYLGKRPWEEVNGLLSIMFNTPTLEQVEAAKVTADLANKKEALKPTSREISKAVKGGPKK